MNKESASLMNKEKRFVSEKVKKAELVTVTVVTV